MSAVADTTVATAAPSTPLAGARICLVFEHSLSHYTRLRQEIAGLIEAGAEVQVLTSHPGDEDPPFGIRRTKAPLEPPSVIPASRIPVRLVRIADNILRGIVRRIANALRRGAATRKRIAALEHLAGEVDLFWVIDFPSLPTAHAVARAAGVPVVYETVDLVAEYRYRGERHRTKSLRIEREIVGDLDGFITASESYADYYMDQYGDILAARPVVRDNMPAEIVDKPDEVHRPLRLLFLGSLMFDRPVLELIDAMALVSHDVTLTFRGKNYVGDEPARRIEALGLGAKVHVLPPCPPSEIVSTAAQFDVGIVALRGIDENERRASTSKLFTYMSAGLAILGSDLPGIARVVRQHDNGVLVEGMAPRAWAEAIDAIAGQNDASIEAMRLRSLEGARPLAWETQRPRFLGVFEQAIARRERARSRTDDREQA